MTVVLLDVRARCEDVNPEAGPPELLAMLHQFIEQVIPKDLENPFPEIRHCRRREDFEAAAPEQKLNLGKSERVVRAVARDLAQFVLF